MFFTRIEELATFLRCRGVPSSLPPCYSDGFRTGHVTKINPRNLVLRFFLQSTWARISLFFPTVVCKRMGYILKLLESFLTHEERGCPGFGANIEEI